MGEVLATYPSGSNPAKKYNVILGNDGVTYCDCMGWKMNKRCKHLTAFNEGVGKKLDNQVFAKKDPKAEIDDAVARIVAEIKGGG